MGECCRPECRFGLGLFLESPDLSCLVLSRLAAAVRVRSARRAMSAMKVKARFTDFILGWNGMGDEGSSLLRGGLADQGNPDGTSQIT